ncbi:MAG TPA: hypothetical protein VLX30_02745 [Burkholderiales bacterium]|nr:hypothetical protein [Burkholderiales bacterium]
MADTLSLLGLLLDFAGALLLVLHRFPALEVTADGRSMAPPQAEPSPQERARNLRRYWRNAVATRAGLVCLCVGFALQLLGFIYPDNGTGATGTTTMQRHVSFAAGRRHGG